MVSFQDFIARNISRLHLNRDKIINMEIQQDVSNPVTRGQKHAAPPSMDRSSDGIVTQSLQWMKLKVKVRMMMHVRLVRTSEGQNYAYHLPSPLRQQVDQVLALLIS